MYVVDEQDVVTPLQGVPQSDTGAPLPLVLQDERRCLVAFLVSDAERNAERTIEARVALAEFAKPDATVFGAPNDEAFAGHPLASRGLRPYGAFEVQQSSWIRALERMNSVHPRHRPGH